MLNTIKAKLIFFSIVCVTAIALSVTFSYIIATASIQEIMENDVLTVADAMEKNINYISKVKPEAYQDPEFKRMVYSVKIGKTGYPFMMNAKGVLTVHPSSEGTGLAGQKHIDHIRANKAGGIYEYKASTTGQEKIVAFRYIKNWDMWVVPGVNKEDYFEHLKSDFLKWNAIFGVIIIGILVAVGTWITKSITGPIRGMLRIFRNMGKDGKESGGDTKETRDLICNLLENMLSRERQ